MPGVTFDAQETDTERTTVGSLVREIAAGGIAAALAGVLVGGIGGRLAMRLSAILNPLRTGIRTDNGNRVGDITVDGTFALFFFGGLLLGAMAGVLWVTVRPWLPKTQRWRYPVAATSAVGLVGFLVVESRNRDFFLLDPRWFHVAMFLSLVATAGVLTAWLDQRLVARWRDARRFTPIAMVLIGFGLPLVIPASAAFFSRDFCACESPPRLTGILLGGVVAITATTWVLRLRGRVPSARLHTLGTAIAVGAVGSGLFHVFGQAVLIV